MAAEELSSYQCKIQLIDTMPTIGRKFLMAGKSGLNITTANDKFLTDFGDAREWISPIIQNFGPIQIIKLCESLGQEIFIGSSGRVFPKVMKASPLLRSWLKKLKRSGVEIQTSTRWLDFEDNPIQSLKNDQLVHRIRTKEKVILTKSRVVIFALGGASWTKLGSDGKWAAVLKRYLRDPETSIIPFKGSNMGIRILWSKQMAQFEGQPVKSVSLKINGVSRKGEFTITQTGVEGGIIYLMSTSQEELAVTFGVDLLPDLSISEIVSRLAQPRGKSTMSNFLRKTLGLKSVKFGLLREFGYPFPKEIEEFAKTIKNLRFKALGYYSMDYAISTRGGIGKHIVNRELMLKDIPGTFCAGEMLDWTAPTGGSLLTGCFATGSHAGKSVVKYLNLKLVN